MTYHYLSRHTGRNVIVVEAYEWRSNLIGKPRRHRVGVAGRVARAAKNRWHAYPANHNGIGPLIRAKTAKQAVDKLIRAVNKVTP